VHTSQRQSGENVKFSTHLHLVSSLRTSGVEPRIPRYALEACTGNSSWNMMAHGDVRYGKWRGNWRMEWVASTLHTTSEHGVSSITTAHAHTLAASSRLNWRPRRFKWTRPFRRKTKSCFRACAITFQLASTTWDLLTELSRLLNFLPEWK